MQRKHILAILRWVMATVVTGLFASWGVTREFWILPWSPLVIGVVVACAISYVVIDRWTPKAPPAPAVLTVPKPTSNPRSPMIRDALAAVDRVYKAQAKMEAANDDGDFPPEKTGEQIFGMSYHADKLTDGTWEIFDNGETRFIAKMSAIEGGWSVIHSRAGYIGKYRNEFQVFEALDLRR